MTRIAGTSWAQREALRALARACKRAGGAIPARKLLSIHYEGRIGKLIDLGLAQFRDGETVEYRALSGTQTAYTETIYEPTAAGHALLARTAGEPPPAPTALRDEHWSLLAILASTPGSERIPTRTAAGIASKAGGGLSAQQAGQRLSLLARHGLVASIDGDWMAPTRWVITTAGQHAHEATQR